MASWQEKYPPPLPPPDWVHNPVPEKWKHLLEQREYAYPPDRDTELFDIFGEPGSSEEDEEQPAEAE